MFKCALNIFRHFKYNRIFIRESFISAGIYMPEPKILQSIRTEIYENTEEYKRIINNNNFKKYFSEVYGEKLKMAPKGFPKEFPDIDLLKYKHYAITYSVKNSFWSGEKVIENLVDVFRVQHPFNQFLNRAVGKAI